MKRKFLLLFCFLTRLAFTTEYNCLSSGDKRIARLHNSSNTEVFIEVFRERPNGTYHFIENYLLHKQARRTLELEDSHRMIFSYYDQKNNYKTIQSIITPMRVHIMTSFFTDDLVLIMSKIKEIKQRETCDT